MKHYLKQLFWDILDSLIELIVIVTKLLQIAVLLVIWMICEIVILFNLTTIHSALVYVANHYVRRTKK